MRTREEILEAIKSIIEDDSRYASDKVLEISDLLDEEGEGE